MLIREMEPCWTNTAGLSLASSTCKHDSSCSYISELFFAPDYYLVYTLGIDRLQLFLSVLFLIRMVLILFSYSIRAVLITKTALLSMHLWNGSAFIFKASKLLARQSTAN
jgi:hypothetical protein